MYMWCISCAHVVYILCTCLVNVMYVCVKRVYVHMMCIRCTGTCVVHMWCICGVNVLCMCVNVAHVHAVCIKSEVVM